MSDEFTQHIIRQAKQGDAAAWERIKEALKRNTIRPEYFYLVRIYDSQWEADENINLRGSFYCLTKRDIIHAIATQAWLELKSVGQDPGVNIAEKETIKKWRQCILPIVKIIKTKFDPQ